MNLSAHRPVCLFAPRHGGHGVSAAQHLQAVRASSASVTASTHA
jgi:hypothetical protein